METHTVLSVCDGISCGFVALERAKKHIKTYYASEINPHAITVSKNNHPEIVQLGDMTKWREWDIPWNEIDLFIGGTPCQGFSTAGVRLNFDDPRSKLFFIYAEILEYIKSLNPSVLFFLENVKMKKEWVDIISKRLNVDPIPINSSLVSAQRRDRLYWSNIKLDSMPDDKSIALVDILDSYVDESYFIPQSTFDKLTETIDGVVCARSLSKKPLPINHGDGIVLSRTWQTYMPVVHGKSHCIRAMNPNDSGVVISRNGQLGARRFTENEIEKLQTLPLGYTNGVSPTKRKSLCGDGWTVDVVAHFFKNI